MNFIKEKGKGLLLCLLIAVPSWFLGQQFPIIGGPVIAIIAGMILTLLMKDKSAFQSGITFTSKKILQWAVILLGFGLNLNVVITTGRQSLPIIIATITTSLVISYALCRVLHMPSKISTLVGVGSSICGGSAVAATAPVIDADDEEVAQAISVIFFFNVLAALIFPALGNAIGFDTTSGEAFGIFAGTAVNDTSSVTAAASTWDSMHGLGSATLDKAVTVKLTRTLAIIPITLVLAFWQAHKAKAAALAAAESGSAADGAEGAGSGFSFRKSFPFFIIYFILASLITTVAGNFGVPASFFAPVKTLSKFFIVLAMAAIGLNSNIIKLIRTGGKPLFMGFCCWVGITGVSLIMQHLLGLW
ncbi:MAG: YeiH family protein [Firmicutes bacterium]|nr:YeiH family protein [Bacillota bacterium]MDD7602613.1 YeiH family protein [Bacillota bacterium]MDY5857159.1 YeiH family protein [Anaerovoracaceae bacterium]